MLSVKTPPISVQNINSVLEPLTTTVTTTSTLHLLHINLRDTGAVLYLVQPAGLHTS